MYVSMRACVFFNFFSYHRVYYNSFVLCYRHKEAWQTEQSVHITAEDLDLSVCPSVCKSVYMTCLSRCLYSIRSKYLTHKTPTHTLIYSFELQRSHLSHHRVFAHRAHSTALSTGFFCAARKFMELLEVHTRNWSVSWTVPLMPKAGRVACKGAALHKACKSTCQLVSPSLLHLHLPQLTFWRSIN